MADTYSKSDEIYDTKKRSLYDEINKNDSSFERIKIFLDWIGKKKTVLDLGCYNGAIGNLVAKNLNDVFGIEASKSACEIAAKRGIKVIRRDLEKNFPFEDNKFDVILAGEVIEHIYDTDFFLKECRRVLKEKGILIVSTPNVVSLHRRICHLWGYAMYMEGSLTVSNMENPAGHIRYYDKSLLIKTVEKNGFKVLKFTSNFIDFPFKTKLKLLAKIFPSFGRNLIMKFEKR